MPTCSSATTASSWTWASIARASSTSSPRHRSTSTSVKQVLVHHDSGIDLLLAPPSPETAELVTEEHLPQILDHLRSLYDYVIMDIDKRLDEINLKILDQADVFFVVMTADLSCLKNVRLVLETIGHLGVEPARSTSS